MVTRMVQSPGAHRRFRFCAANCQRSGRRGGFSDLQGSPLKVAGGKMVFLGYHMGQDFKSSLVLFYLLRANPRCIPFFGGMVVDM